jgi:putative aldouronate transport system substrate-binding protein
MKRLLLSLVLVFTFVLSACNSGNTNNQASPAISPPASTTEAESTPSAEVEKAIDPLGKYDPPIEISTVRSMNGAIQFAEGQSIDNNIWYRGYESDLGIKLSNDWSATDAQYGQKLNVAITSNTLPDIFQVDLTQLQKLIDADMIEELAAVYNQYAAPLTKEILEGDGGIGLNSASKGDQLMALPSTTSTLDGSQMLWVREDWLETVNLPGPKTLDDVQKIAEAFVAQKPGGNPHTYGLGLGKDIFAGYAGVGGLSFGYNAYPKAWVKDASGQVVYGSIQPEMKTALAKLQEMSKAGLIDPEFGVQDSAKVDESIASGKVGMFYGQHWNAFWPIPDSFKNDPKADWKPYPIVTADGSPGKSLLGDGAVAFYVVKKGSAHPEALIKLMNYNLNKAYGPKGRDMNFHGDSVEPAYMYAAVAAQHPLQNINIYRDVIKGIETKSTEGLSSDGAGNYNDMNKFLAGDSTFYGLYKWSGPDGGLSIEDGYDINKLSISNEFIGAPTATMLKKGTTLTTLELETFTKIISNSASIDTFDQFVANWKKLGGDEITKEVNERLSAK